MQALASKQDRVLYELIADTRDVQENERSGGDVQENERDNQGLSFSHALPVVVEVWGSLLITKPV